MSGANGGKVLASSFADATAPTAHPFVELRPVDARARRPSRNSEAGSGVGLGRLMRCILARCIVVLGNDQRMELLRKLEEWQASSAHGRPAGHAG